MHRVRECVECISNTEMSNYMRTNGKLYAGMVPNELHTFTFNKRLERVDERKKAQKPIGHDYSAVTLYCY